MRKLVIVVVLVLLSVSQARPDTPYDDSEFVFARVRFTMSLNALNFFNLERQPPWQHDFPFSERFYLGILRELTALQTSDDAYETVELDSADIFRFPFLYVSEPGFMQLTPLEIDNLREYFNRGGFVMFDDFRGRDLLVLQGYLRQAFPHREMILLDPSHPMFDVFYTIESLDFDPPYTDGRETGPPEFWGMHDESGRLILVANQNNDIGEFWEGLDRAYAPLKPAVDSVRLGINYMIYAMTH